MHADNCRVRGRGIPLFVGVRCFTKGGPGLVSTGIRSMSFYEHLTDFAGLPVVEFLSPAIEQQKLLDAQWRARRAEQPVPDRWEPGDIYAEALANRKSTRLNSSHVKISYAVFCLKKKN